jgi:energy-coupling factor transport system substrate-specific component
MQSKKDRASKRRLTIMEMAVFAMLGALMFCSKIIMEALPNIHLLGMLIMVCTITFRVKALIPLYIYILINGVYAGFATWWIPYLYVWAILWGITMLLPRKMPRKVACVVYPAVCCIYGLLFGVFYAPGQALLYGLGFKGMLAWIAAGVVFDITHMLGNLAAGLLVVPLSDVLGKLVKRHLHYDLKN